MTQKLREIAEKATQGPWENFGGIYVYAKEPESFPVADNMPRLENGKTAILTARGWGHLQYKGEETAIAIQKANVEYMSTFNPQLVQALLDVVDAAEELAKAVAYSKLANYNEARAKLNKLMEEM